MDTSSGIRRNQKGIDIIWENQELNIDAIEADAERDIKPDKNELDRMTERKLLGDEYLKGNKWQNLRASLSSAADCCEKSEESLKELEEQCKSMFDEYQFTSKQFEESLMSGRVNTQKLQDKVLFAKLECDEKLRDVYFQKERYACDLSIQQRKCDTSRDFSRKQSFLISNTKKQITLLQKDIERETNMQSELENQFETLEKDISVLEEMTENNHQSLIDVESNIEMAVRVSLEYKENVAQKDHEISILNQEYQRLLEINQVLSNKVRSTKMVCDDPTHPPESVVLKSSVTKESEHCDPEIKAKQIELEKLISEFNAAEAKLESYNDQANNWITNKKKLSEIRSIGNEISTSNTDPKVKEEIKIKDEEQERIPVSVTANSKDKSTDDEIEIIKLD